MKKNNESNWWRERVITVLSLRFADCILYTAATNDAPFRDEEVAEKRRIAAYARQEIMHQVNALNDDGTFARDFHRLVDERLTLNAFRRDEVVGYD